MCAFKIKAPPGDAGSRETDIFSPTLKMTIASREDLKTSRRACLCAVLARAHGPKPLSSPTEKRTGCKSIVSRLSCGLVLRHTRGAKVTRPLGTFARGDRDGIVEHSRSGTILLLAARFWIDLNDPPIDIGPWRHAFGSTLRRPPGSTPGAMVCGV